MLAVPSMAVRATDVLDNAALAAEPQLYLGALPKHAICTCIDLDVTDECNLACGYCFKGDKSAQYMHLHTAKVAADWLIAASGTSPIVSVNFMGGEPTMNWRLIDAYMPWARRRVAQAKKRIEFSMTSNLTLWNEQIFDTVHSQRMGVLMSFDGCPEVQDAQRPTRNGKRSSELVSKWAKRMLERRPQSDARMTISKFGIPYLVKSVEYLIDEIGFKSIVFATADTNTWSSDEFSELNLRLTELGQRYLTWLQNGRDVSIQTFDYMNTKVVRHHLAGRETPVRRSPCGAGHNYQMIDFNGDIWPCHRFDTAIQSIGMSTELRLGNIFHGDYNSKFGNAFLNFDHLKVYKERCAECTWRAQCAGGCPAENLFETRSIYTPHDSYCDIKAMEYNVSKQILLDANNLGLDLYLRRIGV